jgi:hypothetical protein
MHESPYDHRWEWEINREQWNKNGIFSLSGKDKNNAAGKNPAAHFVYNYL